VRLGIAFDLRNPEPWRRPWVEHYGASLEVMEEADRLGLDVVKVAEHHCFEDGYSPQPLTFLAAAAARTTRIGLATGILIAPLHKSAEIAEQAGVVDGLSGGRLELALGTGYHRPEYELYGVPLNQRFKLLEQRVVEVRELWASARATPVPERGEVPIWLGVSGPRGSEIAGRLGTGLFTLVADHWQVYLDALLGGGHDRSVARAGGSLQLILSEDPERDFRTLAPRIKHNADTYLEARYAGTGEPTPALMDVNELLNNGEMRSKPWTGFGVLTPEEAAERILRLGEGRALSDVDIVYIQVSPAGVIDDIARRNVELVANELRPRLDAAMAAPA
jgi:alkanesulfonate monooxygenase SsuD/methylene tetrahydromethanopterin reductase-like flavin-dependent oxidoreductase (luciferase family)